MTSPVASAENTQSGLPRAQISFILDPDAAELFPDSKTVNEALRALSKIADRQRKMAGRNK